MKLEYTRFFLNLLHLFIYLCLINYALSGWGSRNTELKVVTNLFQSCAPKVWATESVIN